MRRPRSFWEARVAELARGRSVASVALQHGVMPDRLRWWRWRLGSAPATSIVQARMIEILPAPAAVTGSLRMLVGDVVLELPAGTSAEYVGRVLGATRVQC